MTKLNLSVASCLLFVPGHRPDRYDKARAASPDGVIIDLEDSVPPAEKDAARAYAGEDLRAGPRAVASLVRINALGTEAALDDLAALVRGGLRLDGIFLSKVEDPRDIEIARAYLPPGLPILAALETARGIAAASGIAARLGPGDALGFGGADLAADLGAAFAWEPLFAARAAIVAAAATARLPVFDVPCLALDDADALRDETRRVRALGFTAKLAIHPAQVAPIRAIFTPGADEVAEARRIVAALDAAAGGVARLDGRMIDAPVAQSARRTLARAEHATTRDDQGA